MEIMFWATEKVGGNDYVVLYHSDEDGAQLSAAAYPDNIYFFVDLEMAEVS